MPNLVCRLFHVLLCMRLQTISRAVMGADEGTSLHAGAPLRDLAALFGDSISRVYGLKFL